MDFTQSPLGLVAQYQEIPFQARLLKRIDSIKPSISSNELNTLLKDIIKELRKDFKLTYSTIEKLLVIQSHKQESGDYSALGGFLNIFARSLMKQPKYCSNKKIISIIEEGILSKKINKGIVNGYNIIIREKSYLKLGMVIDTLADLLINSNNSNELNKVIFGCISSACAAEVSVISEKCLSLFEFYLLDDSSDSEIIRSLSFRGLLTA